MVVARPAAALKLLITALTLVEEEVTAAAGPPGKGTEKLLLTPTPPVELDSFDGLGVP